jgi:hypothetical protein
MKYSIILFLLLIVTAATKAQNCNTCGYKGITTDPSQPVNTEKGTKKNTFFDWTNLGQYEVFSQNWPSPYNRIESPFNQVGNFPLAQFIDNPDRLPQNGWELIKYNLGFKDDHTPNGLPNRDIYIVLYNKYTGILRVFVAANELVSYNGIHLTAKFASGTQTNLLSNASENFAMDQFQTMPLISSIAKQIPSSWAYADYHMSYDPCSCFHESLMGIEIEYLNTTTLKLSGSINGELVSKDSNSKVTDVKEDGYSFANVASAAKGAKKSFDDVQKWANDQFTAIANEGKTNKEIAAKADETKKTIDFFQGLIKSSKFLQTGLKAVPYVGAALSFIDMFTGGGGNSGPQDVKVMPMSLQANVTLSGDIVGAYGFPSILTYTPGSLKSSCKSEDLYPYYNEVLGTFNLLETPTYKAIVVPSQTICQPQTFPRNCTTYPGYTYYRMAEHIRFAVNPAALMDVQEMQMQVIVKQGRVNKTDSIIWSTPMLPVTAIKDFNLQGIIGNPDPKVFVKLFVNFRRKDAGPDTQNVLFVTTYQAATSKPGTFTGWSDNYSSNYDPTDLLTYPGQLILNADQSLNTTKVALNDIFIQQGQQITGYTTKLEKTDHGWVTVSVPIYGPKNITITSTSGGKLLANNSVVVQPGASISAGITLAIGLPNGNPNVTPVPQSDATIQSFCNSSAYKVPTRLLRPDKDLDDEQKQSVLINQGDLKEKRESETSAYPNPSTGIVTFRYSLAEPSQAQLTLLDINGQLIDTVVSDYQQAGAHEASYDLSALPNGIYIYTLETSKGKETRRIVVIR